MNKIPSNVEYGTDKQRNDYPKHGSLQKNAFSTYSLEFESESIE